MRRFAPMLILALGAGGCATVRSAMGTDGQRISLRPSESTPGAQGHVKVVETDDKNNELAIEVSHLPPANRLDPQKSKYMVWIDPGDGRTIPLGQLELDKNQSAEATLTTPFETFELIVTAEPPGAPDQPSDAVVLRGRVGYRPGS